MNNHAVGQGGEVEPPVPASARQKRAPNPKPRRLGYPPMTMRAFDAHMKYLRQALDKLLDPSAPEPDAHLLTIDPRLPFTSIKVEPDPVTGEPAIHFTLRNKERSPRWCPPEVFLLLSLFLAYGGGMSINDNGTGMAYVRLWGGHDRYMFGRIIRNARPGQVVKQDPEADHHEQHPLNFETRGRPKAIDKHIGQAAHSTREDAIETALRYQARNSYRAEFTQTPAEFRAVLHDAIRVVDAYFAEDAA